MRGLVPLALLLAVACHRSDVAPAPPPAPGPAHPMSKPDPAAPAVVFTVGGTDVRVEVEVVRTPSTVQRGLMYRTFLPPEQGMLFLFKHAKVQHFWMKNTLIPLDMIFVASDLTVAGVVANAEPETTTSRNVDAESQFVVEVNGGWAAKHGVTAGTKVAFAHVDLTGEMVDY